MGKHVAQMKSERHSPTPIAPRRFATQGAPTTILYPPDHQTRAVQPVQQAMARSAKESANAGPCSFSSFPRGAIGGEPAPKTRNDQLFPQFLPVEEVSLGQIYHHTSLTSLKIRC